MWNNKKLLLAKSVGLKKILESRAEAIYFHYQSHILSLTSIKCYFLQEVQVKMDNLVWDFLLLFWKSPRNRNIKILFRKKPKATSSTYKLFHKFLVFKYQKAHLWISKHVMQSFSRGLIFYGVSTMSNQPIKDGSALMEMMEN